MKINKLLNSGAVRRMFWGLLFAL